MQQEGGVRSSRYRSDYVNDTHFEYIYSIDWHSLPSSGGKATHTVHKVGGRLAVT